jgi:glycosyltransferase involved in cell wall biosynthesis
MALGRWPSASTRRLRLADEKELTYFVKLSQVTPLILTCNEEANIARSLEHLGWAERIVVVDSNSTDRTRSILERNPRVTLLTRDFDSFARQCNFGLARIDSEWVLSLDADYICSADLSREIEGLPEQPAHDGFRAGFRYCVNGRPLRATLYPERVVLYRRARAHYEDDGHAHHVVIDGQIGALHARILHDDRKSLESWLNAQRRYALREADKLLSAAPETLSTADRIRLWKWFAPLVIPLYCLIGRGLLMDGLAGLMYSLQRTYAEALLSLVLIQRELDNRLARKAQKVAPPDADGS